MARKKTFDGGTPANPLAKRVELRWQNIAKKTAKPEIFPFQPSDE
jgi:hypothetical protein